VTQTSPAAVLITYFVNWLFIVLSYDFTGSGFRSCFFSPIPEPCSI